MFSDANLPSVRISDCRIVAQMPVLVKRTMTSAAMHYYCS